MNEFLEQFLIESRELVEQATHDLLTLEHDPGNRAMLDSAFRAFHTLKGSAGIMDFAAMARLTHAAEDLLASVRAGDQALTPQIVTRCLTCLDHIVSWMNQIESTGALPATPDQGEPASGIAAAPAALPGAVRQALPAEAIELLKEQVALVSIPPDAGFLGRLAAAGKVCRNVLRHFAYLEEAEDVDVALALLKAALLTAPDGASGVPAPELAPLPPDSAIEREAVFAQAQSLRVEVARIEEIVKITGELMVANNALDHLVRSLDGSENPAGQHPALRLVNGRLNRLTSQLLRAVLATRVLPLERVFKRFPRLVREMALQLQKPVRLVTEGELTEADKVIVEALFEPILHVLRNAIDHGIEAGDARRAAGKPETAIITLRGRRNGDQVEIEIADDGAGIDLAAIRKTAISRQLITADAAAQLADAQALDLIFLPGFSTARQVSDISGRGVGMDAVRAGVERLGGQVSLHSVPAVGTTVSFVLPFTVLVTRVLTLHAGGQMFGLPFDAVQEMLQLPATRAIAVGSALAIRLHGKTIPLISLAAALDLEERPSAPHLINAVVVKGAGGALGALQVERFGGQFDMILKPMEGLLAGTPGIAGSTLLGDGRVLIVLEVEDLLRSI